MTPLDLLAWSGAIAGSVICLVIAAAAIDGVIKGVRKMK